ncbi:ATP-binding cassette domain-containing protein [Saccharospirillum mangrovi]|uniref:ATP-binding cassette domain-containing protein n=1 Tax=Saccharospirillum mangrovi TaxID=2161747 RepID=UPI0013009613|nr:ATP-binding cassette domain-containing protein [Saccharospirillum mangrovi]
MLPLDSRTRQWQWAGFGLALVYLGMVLGLLALSGWFIAAAAIAGAWGLAAQFNYVVPSTLIRMIAFLRVLSGYGERYVGHLGLLSRLGAVRARLFRTLVHNPDATPSTEALERVDSDADALASLWVQVWHPLGSAAAVCVALSLLFAWLVPTALGVWLGFAVVAALLLVIAWQRHRRQVASSLAAQASVRNAWLNWSNTAPIWRLLPGQGKPEPTQAAWHSWQQADLAEEASVQRLELSLQILGWLAVLVFGWALTQTVPDPSGQALLLVPVLIWLAARDWLSGAARALPELSRRPQRAARLRPLLSAATAGTETCPPWPGDTPVQLRLSNYRWQRADRFGSPINLNLDQPALVLLDAGSGQGKSSLFQALLGRLPEAGEMILNGQSGDVLTDTQRRACFHLSEQFGHVFSDTLAANLRLAKPDASDAECLAALRWAELDDWANADDLEMWIGEPGRPLSGGEQKRLNLARAWLRDAPVWLLDEPFEGLDDSRQQRLAKRLHAVAQQRLVILASHLRPPALQPTDVLRW